MPKIKTDTKEDVERDLFPLNPAMIRRLRAHDESVAAQNDKTPTIELKFLDSDD